MNEKITEILTETGKVIRGKDAVIERILMAILSEGNILLEDVPGVGKTTLALAFSKVLGLSYQHHAVGYHRFYHVRPGKRDLPLSGGTGAAV